MQFDVISIGTATVDVVVKPSSASHIRAGQLCVPSGAKIAVDDFCVASGGGATNAAVTFARMGLRSGTVFEVGADALGEYVIREMQRERISVFASRNKTLPTAGSVIVVDKTGERTVFTHRGAANDLTLQEIPLGRIRAPWWYVVPGGIAPNAIIRVVRHAKRSGAKVAVNPSEGFIRKGWAQFKPVLRSIDVLLVNREEALLITKTRDFKTALRRLDASTQGMVVITNGKKGVAVSDGERIWEAGTFKNKKVVDRLGAGDAFGSGFVAGLIAMGERCAKGACDPRAIEYAIRLGSANATSVVEAVGAKAGILTKRAFTSSRRWKNLNIQSR